MQITDVEMQRDELFETLVLNQNIKILRNYWTKTFLIIHLVQSAGAAEYTDYFSAEG